jgi:hypothetical protein
MNENGKAVASASTLTEGLERIQTRQHCVDFVQALVQDLQANPQQWENSELRPYLEALGAFVNDIDGYFQNRGETMPEQPTWKMLAQVLLAARVYE